MSRNVRRWNRTTDIRKSDLAVRAGASTRLRGPSGDGQRRLAGCTARDDAGHRALLGDYDRRKCAQPGAAGIERTYAVYDGPVP